MTEKYVIGNVINLTASFTDSSGVAVAPTSVSLTIKLPNGTTTTQTATSSSTGNYSVSYLPTTAGLYSYYFIGTGAVQAAGQGQFNIIQSNVA